MKSWHIFLAFILTVAHFSAMAVDIEGVVVDEKGNGLAYASVYLMHTPDVGTITDANGRFELSVPNARDSLIVTMVGYKTVYINLSKVKSFKSMRITMKKRPIILNEVVVQAGDKKNAKKSKKQLRAETQAVLQKVYDRIVVDFPIHNVKHRVVSDLTAISEGQVVLFDEWIGDIVELRDYRGTKDSIQMKTDVHKRYVNKTFKNAAESFDPSDYSKKDMKHLGKIDLEELKRIDPHKIAWDLDVQRVFKRYMSDVKHWSMAEKDGSTIVLTLTLTNKFPGIYSLVRKLIFAVDKYDYSVKTVSERVSAELNIPFGYKLTDAELAILNTFALDHQDFEKYRVKSFKGTSNRNSIYHRDGNQLVVSERNFTADGYVVDNKDNKLNFGSKIKSTVLSVEARNVKPYSAAQLKSGKTQYLDAPRY
ncbi:MAG: carboxypeptidase-like regulatory domain-containing protein [Bacteroidales bacterium]|nr:carboxypeptidase-like regulatory domain-containing protein [Bacteroidales bacterium]